MGSIDSPQLLRISMGGTGSSVDYVKQLPTKTRDSATRYAGPRARSCVRVCVRVRACVCVSPRNAPVRGIMLYHVVLLLGNDCKLGNYTTAVVKQRLSSNHPNRPNQQLRCDRGTFSTQSVPRYYKHGQFAQ
jgi:hypothetical protein